MSPQHDDPYRGPDAAIEMLKACFGFLGGLLATAVITGMMSGLVVFLAGIIGLIASTVQGPVVGILIWNATRDNHRWFGRGALILGIVWFFLAGSCTLAYICLSQAL